jgi:hypothetical protein
MFQYIKILLFKFKNDKHEVLLEKVWPPLKKIISYPAIQKMLPRIFLGIPKNSAEFAYIINLRLLNLILASACKLKIILKPRVDIVDDGLLSTKNGQAFLFVTTHHAMVAHSATVLTNNGLPCSLVAVNQEANQESIKYLGGYQKPIDVILRDSNVLINTRQKIRSGISVYLCVDFYKNDWYISSTGFEFANAIQTCVVFEHSRILNDGSVEILLKKYTNSLDSPFDIAHAYQAWLASIDPGFLRWKVSKFFV